jgi:sec-independent protein translocase protein TatC
VAYAAIVIALPVILYQAYAFVLPALTPTERRVIVPFLIMVPVLFVAGVVFAYFVVVPAAVKFLLNFNQDQFNIQVRAREYYSFFAITLAAVGILFQVPIGILAITRLGIVTPEQLAKNRRYAILVIAVLAMLLPGTDPVTMLISMVPLIILFEGSLLLSRVIGRPPEPEPGSELAASEPTTEPS